MAEEVKDLAGHILAEIHRIHNSHDKIFEKLSEQGETLVRNTSTLEEHVRRTNLLETKMTHVETEVDGLKSHVQKVNFVLGLLKPTKEKIKWLMIVSALLSGSYGGYQLADPATLNRAVKTIEKVLE